AAWGAGNRPAPSNRLVYGQIGVGNRGRDHLGWAAADNDLQFVAICDVNTPARDAAKAHVDNQYGNKDCVLYNDFREILARPDIDAVLIAVPDHWHALISIAAMQAGKDVYCEKPLALTIQQADAITTAARR